MILILCTGKSYQLLDIYRYANNINLNYRIPYYLKYIYSELVFRMSSDALSFTRTQTPKYPIASLYAPV